MLMARPFGARHASICAIDGAGLSATRDVTLTPRQRLPFRSMRWINKAREQSYSSKLVSVDWFDPTRHVAIVADATSDELQELGGAH